MSEKLRDRPIFRTVMLFVSLLCIAVMLIMFGRRSDAMTQAYYAQSGVLQSREVAVSARHVSGTLLTRAVTESDQVKKGDLLLRLDPEDYEIALQELEANSQQVSAQIKAYQQSIAIAKVSFETHAESTRRTLESTLAQLASDQTALDTAQANFQRYQKLLRSRAVSQADYDRVKSEFESARAALTSSQKSLDSLLVGVSLKEREAFFKAGSADKLLPLTLKNELAEIANMENTLAAYEAQLKSLEVQIAKARLDLSRTAVTAPCDGKILKVNYEEGELVAADSPAVILETDALYVDVFLPEGYALDYKAQDEVELFAPALEQRFKGVVRYINPAPSYAALAMTREQGQADLTTYEMRIDLADKSLIPGLTLELSHD